MGLLAAEQSIRRRGGGGDTWTSLLAAEEFVRRRGGGGDTWHSKQNSFQNPVSIPFRFFVSPFLCRLGARKLFQFGRFTIRRFACAVEVSLRFPNAHRIKNYICCHLYFIPMVNI